MVAPERRSYEGLRAPGQERCGGRGRELRGGEPAVKRFLGFPTGRGAPNGNPRTAVKSEARQAAAGLHKLRALLSKQRTMVINQLRGLMAAFGSVVAKGPHHVGAPAAVLDDPAAPRIAAAPLGAALVPMAELWRDLERRLAAIDQILEWGRTNARWRHLITMPGFGPILASAMAANVVDPGACRSGRDFAAALALVPRQDGTGGTVKLGPIRAR